MAHPFAPMLPLAEFVERALAAGCEEIPIKSEIVGHRGPAAIRCLKGANGALVVLPSIADDECLTPGVFLNLCRRLGIEGVEWD